LNNKGDLPRNANTGTVAFIVLVLGFTGLNLLISIQAVALDMESYISTWTGLDIPTSAAMSLDDLRLVGSKLLGYFTGTESTPQVTAAIDGTLRPVFREHEIEHLYDVRDLFQLGFGAKRVCQALIVLGILLAAWQPGVNGYHDKRQRLFQSALRVGLLVSKSLKAGGILLLAATVLLGLPAALDFTRWWTGFHLITFDNDLWRLDPATDWLIRIFPEEFFFAAVKRIAMYSIAIAGTYIVLGIILRFSVGYLSSDHSKQDF